MIETSGVERLEPPREYADLLKRIGGSNLFGEPNFILFWGQTHVPRGICPQRLLGENRPCWNLAMWRPAEEWGTPSTWDHQSLGDYPSRGAYDLIQPLYRSLGKDGIEAMPLNFLTLEMMVHVIEKHKGDSLRRRKEALEAEQSKNDKATLNRIEDCIRDAVPAFGESASYSGQTNTNTFLAQKIAELEKWMPKIPRRKGAQINA